MGKASWGGGGGNQKENFANNATWDQANPRDNGHVELYHRPSESTKKKHQIPLRGWLGNQSTGSRKGGQEPFPYKEGGGTDTQPQQAQITERIP